MTVVCASGHPKRFPRALLPVGIFALAAGLRVFLFTSLFGSEAGRELFSNSFVLSKYPWIADKLVHHVPVGERILDFSPFYTFTITVLSSLFPGSHLAYGIFQVLVGSINCLLIYRVAAKVSTRAIGATSGLAAALYAPFMLYELVLEPEILIVFLNLASLLLLLACLDKRNSLWWFLPGVTLGLSFITRPNILVFAVFVLLWLLSTFRRTPRSLAGILLAISAGFLVAASPVFIRNHRISGMVLKPLMSSGQVTYQGNNPTAKGFYGSHPFLLKEMEVDPAINPDDEPDFAHELYRSFAAESTGTAGLEPQAATRTGADTESYWYQRSFNFILRHPRAYLGLLGAKFRAFWSSHEIHDVLPLYHLEWKMDRFPLLKFGMVVPFAIAGMLLAAKERSRYLLLYGFVFNYLVSNLMFFVTSRQRLLALPFLIIFAATALVWGVGTVRSRLESFVARGAPFTARARLIAGTAGGACALLLLWSLVNLPVPQLEHFETFLRLNRDSRLHLASAQAAARTSEFRGVRRQYRTAFALMPFHPSRIPNRYLGGGGEKFRDAVPFWENVLSRKGDNSYARFSLGYLRFMGADYDGALREMKPLADAGEEFFLGYLLPIAQPRFYVARCLEEQGDLSAATAEYETIVRERPGLPWVAARLLVLYEIAGDGGKARVIQRALEQFDNPVSSSYLLAEAYHDRGRHEQAVKVLEGTRSRLLDRYAPYHFLLSACYAQWGARAEPGRRQGLIAAAVRECRRGLQLGTGANRIAPAIAAAYQAAIAAAPEDFQLHYELGMVYLSLGELESAKASLLNALAPRAKPLPEAIEGSIRAALEEIAFIDGPSGGQGT